MSVIFLSLILLAFSIVFIFDLVRVRSGFFGSYISLLFILSYVVAPASIVLFGFGFHPYFVHKYATCTNDCEFIVFSIIFIFSLSYLFGFFVFKPKKKYYLFLPEKFQDKKLIFILFMIVLISFFAFLYFYGGITHVLNNASKIRSGSDDNKNYLGAFFRMFTYYIDLIVFFAYAKNFESIKSNKIFSLLFFVFIIILFFLKAMLDAGRGGFVNVLLGLIFISIFYNGGRLPILKILIVFIISLFVGIYGKIYLFQIFSDAEVVFDSKNALDGLEAVIIEFSHQYSSLLLSADNELGGTRMYMDYFVWILKPLKLIGISVPDSISYYNTYNITGVWDSEIPPGIIAFGFYQGHIIGVILVGLFCGYLVRFIDELIINTIKLNFNSKAFLYSLLAVVCIYLPFLFINSDPALFIQFAFVYILFFVILFFSKKLRLKH